MISVVYASLKVLYKDFFFFFFTCEINCQCILDYSSGTFISASEDDSGVLDIIEEKIARATMLPRAHGEVFF